METIKIKDISLWEAYYWVAKEENFTRAANKLNVGTPILSKRVSRLEEVLGIQLFQRTTRKVKATQEGLALFPLIEAALEDLKGLEERFSKKEELEGTISITCVTGFAHRILAPLLIEFNRIHPKIKLDVTPSDEILNLIDNQIDVAIRVQSPLDSGQDYVYKKLIENKLVLCASLKYLQSLKFEIKKPDDLKKCSILMLEVYKNCRFVKTGMKLESLLDRQRIICDSGMLLTELAKCGGGIAVRSLWDVQKYFDSGELVQVLPNHPLESFGTIYSVIPTRRLLSHRVRAFIDFISASMQNFN